MYVKLSWLHITLFKPVAGNRHQKRGEAKIKIKYVKKKVFDVFDIKLKIYCYRCTLHQTDKRVSYF